MALGPEADKVIASFCAAIGEEVPPGVAPPPDNQLLFWNRSSGAPATSISVEGPRQTRKRHKRKYAEGDLGDSSFYFRGPDGALKLKAQNLMMFLHIAEGIDDRTWKHHLEAGDYSGWFREKVKDEELADEAAGIEADGSLDPKREPLPHRRSGAAPLYRSGRLTFGWSFGPYPAAVGEEQSSIWDCKMKSRTVSVLRPANQEALRKTVDPSLSLGVCASLQFTG